MSRNRSIICKSSIQRVFIGSWINSVVCECNSIRITQTQLLQKVWLFEGSDVNNDLT